LAQLGWSPRDFWSATLADLRAAADYQRDAASGLMEEDVRELKYCLKIPPSLATR